MPILESRSHPTTILDGSEHPRTDGKALAAPRAVLQPGSTTGDKSTGSGQSAQEAGSHGTLEWASEDANLVELDRCNDCALTLGTKANLSPLSASKAEMCAMIGERFWCHVGTERKLCAGWTERVVTSEIAPKDCPPWRRKLAETTLKFIDSVEDRDKAGTLPGDDELIREHVEMLRDCLDAQQHKAEYSNGSASHSPRRSEDR